MPTLARRTRVIVAALSLGAACGDNPVGPAESVDVFTPGNTFSPFSASVEAGGVVRFNIFGDEHDVKFSHSVAGYPADIIVVRDTVVSRTFLVAGTFSYACNVHPGMNGEIVVR